MTTKRTKLTQADACLIGGGAARLLREARDRITDPEVIEMLEDLECAPYAAVVANGGNAHVLAKELAELEAKLGLPDIGPDAVYGHAYAKLAEAYEERDVYVDESLSENGLKLIDPYEYEEGNRVRFSDRDKAHAWFEDEDETARDSDNEDEDAS
jgi:hypothetical protein